MVDVTLFPVLDIAVLGRVLGAVHAVDVVLGAALGAAPARGRLIFWDPASGLQGAVLTLVALLRLHAVPLVDARRVGGRSAVRGADAVVFAYMSSAVPWLGAVFGLGGAIVLDAPLVLVPDTVPGEG